MEWFKRNVACLLSPENKDRSDEVPVKIFFQEEIRRTAIPETMEMKDLESLLREKFSVEEHIPLRVTYSITKNDPLLPLENQFDLDTAIQCAKTSNPPLFRLTVEKVQEALDDWHLVESPPAEKKEELKAIPASANVEETKELLAAENPIYIPSKKVTAEQPQASLPPRNKFEETLITLRDMGFTNRELNIRLLVANVGNLEDTIEALTHHVEI